MLFQYTIYCNISSRLSGLLYIQEIIKINKPNQAKSSHMATLKISTYIYLKHWKSLETTLITESNLLLAKRPFPIHTPSFLFVNVILILYFI